MSSVVARNIAALMRMRAAEERQQKLSDRIAGVITEFAGSMVFIYVHLVVLVIWLGVNSGLLPVLPAWDPYPFVMLAMAASVEAIFLSAFILVTQNRIQRFSEQRAEMDLHVSLLSEHELTRAIRLLDGIAAHLNVPRPAEEEMDELKRDVNPAKVARAIDETKEQGT